MKARAENAPGFLLVPFLTAPAGRVRKIVVRGLGTGWLGSGAILRTRSVFQCQSLHTADWLHSSFHHYVKNACYAWGEIKGRFGE